MSEVSAEHTSTSAGIKAVVIGVVSLALCVPLVMVDGLVWERSSRRDEVREAFSAVWGRRQAVGGVALSVPFDVVRPGPSGPRQETGRLIALPDSLVIDVDVVPEVRRRSIFDVVLYRATVTMTGTFRRPDAAQWIEGGATIRWDQARFSVRVNDMRGVASLQPVTWGQETMTLDSHDGGVFGSLSGQSPWPSESAEIAFRLNLTLAGTSGLAFVPAGRTTRVQARSAWPHPSFVGAYLPESHQIDGDGFEAAWQTSHLSRGYPAVWVEGAIDAQTLARQIAASEFGVDLLQPVDHYRQADRATKYGFLFVVSTLVGCLLAEILTGARLHPIHYLLVGAALVVFFLLLLSLSEHVGFVIAYATASTATVILIAGYAARILARRRAGMLMAVWLGALYGALYVLLQLEDLALLVGSLIVFGALAGFMFITRRFDWYTLRRVTT